MPDSREERIAFVRRERAQLEAREAALRLAPRSQRRSTGTSIVFSVRLDPAEVEALAGRAALIGTKPTVLACNLIRTGRATPHGADVAEAVDRLEAAMSELRSLVV